MLGCRLVPLPCLKEVKLFPLFNGKKCHEMSVGMEPSSNMKQACMEETMKCERDHFYMSRLIARSTSHYIMYMMPFQPCGSNSYFSCSFAKKVGIGWNRHRIGRPTWKINWTYPTDFTLISGLYVHAINLPLCSKRLCRENYHNGYP